MVVFWWTLGPVGAAIVCTILFLEDTQRTMPKPWLANRLATFVPGTKTQPPGKGKEFVS